MQGYDPRRVANLLLDLADARGIELCQIKLQKLLYFADDAYFMRARVPLVAGDFEAWEYGPVNPTVYQAFKPSGAEPIKFRATKRDLRTGETVELEPIEDIEVHDELVSLLRTHGRLSASQLVNISHAPGGPWDEARRRSASGLAIGNIVERRNALGTSKPAALAVTSSSDSSRPLAERPYEEEMRRRGTKS